MKKIIELAEKLVEQCYNGIYDEPLCENLDELLYERERLQQNSITEEWLKEHGFIDEPQERMLIYRKGTFSIECDLTTWEWYWANGDVTLKSLADLYDACELCNIEL